MSKGEAFSRVFPFGGQSMPVYEYRCTKCNKHFEIKQKISDDPLTRCKECNGELKKLITSTSFVLKGSGWYVTDYPSAERKKALESKNKKNASKDKSAEKKTDTNKKTVAQ
jgi:putative FmdB family regulatory protein